MNTDEILNSLKERWPSAIVARTEIILFTGGLINERYMANLDSAKKGPKNRFRMGRKIVYKVDDLIDWLKGQIVDPNKKDKHINTLHKYIEGNFSK